LASFLSSNLDLRKYLKRLRASLGSDEIRLPLAIWLYSRIFFYGSAFVLAKILHLNFSLTIFRFWDAGWYLSIINDGYMGETISTGPETDRANWAFFPVLPFLVRILAVVIRVDVLWIAYFVSNLSLLIGLYFLYKYLTREYSTKVARITLIFIAFSPVNVYLTTLYTESLFFALLMAMIFYTREHKWIVAGIVGAFLTGTRNTGIFMIAIYIFEFVRSSDWRSSTSERHKFLTGLLIFPLGLVAFMIHLRIVTGDPLAFYRIQSEWGGPQVSHLAFAYGLVSQPSAFRIFTLVVIACSVLSCAYLLWKKKLIDFWVLFPVTFISLDALRINYRFYFALYPIYLVFAILIQKREWLMRVAIVIEALALVVAVKLWITGYGLT